MASKKPSGQFFKFKYLIAYAVLGGLWVYVSDDIIYWVIDVKVADNEYYILKGLFFLMATTLLFFLLLRDFTRKIRSYEYRIEANKDYYSVITENITDVVLRLTKDGDISYASKAASAVLGYRPHELQGKNLMEFVAEGDKSKIIDYKNELSIHTSLRIIFRFEHGNGEQIWIETSCKKLVEGDKGTQGDIICIARDITSRRSQEQEQEKRSNLLNDISGRISTFIYKINGSGIITDISGKGLKKLMERPEELKGVKFSDRYPHLKQYLEQAGKGETVTFISHGKHRGQPWWFKNFLFPESSDGGGATGFAVDITELKLAQEEVQRTRELYEMVLRNMPHAAVAMFDADYRYYLLEGKIVQEFGGDPVKMVGKTLFEAFPKKMVATLTPHHKAALNGKEQIYEINYEDKYYVIHTSAMRNAENKIIGGIIVGQDITPYKDMETRLLNAYLEGQDRERKRIAEDLHDGLGQVITGAKLNLFAFEDLYAAMDEEKQRLFRTLKETLENAANEVRAISHNLMPSTLDDFGLVSATKDLCYKLSSGQINIECVNLPDTLDLDKNVEMALYRILQELVNNALKHSNAETIRIDIVDEGESLVLTVEDDGEGFDTEAMNTDSLGFSNIKTRVKALKGRLEIHSLPEQGTTAIIEIPLLKQVYEQNKSTVGR